MMKHLASLSGRDPSKSSKNAHFLVLAFEPNL